MTLKNQENREPLIKQVYQTRGMKQPLLFAKQNPVYTITTEQEQSVIETDVAIDINEGQDEPPMIVLKRVEEACLDKAFQRNRSSIAQISNATMDDTVVMTESVLTDNNENVQKKAAFTFRNTVLQDETAESS